MSGNIQAIAENPNEESMETEGAPGKTQKIRGASEHKRPRMGDDGKTLGLGASTQEDIHSEMQTDRHDDEVASDAHANPSSDSLHSQLFTFIGHKLTPAMSHYRSFLTHVGTHLTNYDLGEAKEDSRDILVTLEKRGKIGKGNYNVLLQILKDANLISLKKLVAEQIKPIHDAMEAEGESIPPAYRTPVEEVVSSARLHSLLKEDICRNLVPEMTEYPAFLNSVKMFLRKGRVAYNQETAADIFDMLEEDGFIDMGNYDKLEMILRSCGLKALQTKVAEWGRIIRQAMEEEGRSIPVTNDGQALTPITMLSSDRQHAAIFICIDENIDPNEYKSFLNIVTEVYLSQGEVETYENVTEILEALESRNIFCKGDYHNLIKILEGAYLNSLATKVQKMQTEILKKMLEEELPLPDSKPESEADRILGMQNSLFEYVNRHLSSNMLDYKSFLNMCKPHLAGGIIEANRKSVTDILRALQRNERIAVGNYTVFLEILEGSSLIALKNDVEKKQQDIRHAMTKNGKRIPDVKKLFCPIREQKSSDEQHIDLFNHIGLELKPEMSDYASFLNAAKLFLPPGTIAENKQSVINVLEKLQTENFIGKGNYRALLDILKLSDLLKLRGEVEKRGGKIKQAMAEEGESIEPVEDGVSESVLLHRQLLEEVHRALSPTASHYKTFKRNVGLYLQDQGAVANSKTTADLLDALETANKLAVGNYETLITALQDSHLVSLAKKVRRDQEAINIALKKENPDL